MPYMKIAMISGHPRDWHAGASTIYLHLARELHELGHRIDLYHQEDYAPGRRSAWIRKLMTAGAIRRRLLEKVRDADVLDVAGNAGWRIFGALKSLPNARRPLLVTRLQGLELKYEQARISEEIARRTKLPLSYKLFTRHWINWQEFRTLAICDLVLCYASREADAVLTSKLKAEDGVTVVPVGADEEYFEPREYRVPARRLLWMSSWVELKGIADLPRAFELACRRIPDLVLTIAGCGRRPEEVLCTFPPARRAQITVLPFITQEEHIAILQDHDVFLFTSLCDSFGLTLLEAMASGMPCITTYTGMAHDHVEHGENCLTVPMNGPTSVARAIEKMVEDAPLRRRLGRRAQETARDLTWRKCARRCADVYASHLAVLRGKAEDA